MKKKYSASSVISIMFIAMTVTFCLTMLLSTRMFEQRVESVSEKESMYDKISDIDSVVRQNFYSSVDETKIFDALSAGYMNGLSDGDSRYYSADELIEYQQVIDGKTIGIGAEIVKSRENGGYMLVYKVYTDSPADIRGIEYGDLISSINGISTVNMSVDTAKNMLTGIAGKTVEITYVRDSAENTATMTRRAFDLPEISYSKENDCGYINISTFTTGTRASLEYAVNNLISQKVSSLVIDVRGNDSKDFDAAAESADVLIPEGTIMYATYKDGEKKVLYTSDKNSVDLPVVVITDGGTGYSAEMFAIMMKDSMGAKIVGNATKGHGTLQKLFRLPDGSGIELTVATLSPVVSDNYNGSGILPDYEKGIESGVEFYLLTISNDPQIQRALEVAANLAGKQTPTEEKKDEASTENVEEASDEKTEETDE